MGVGASTANAMLDLIYNPASGSRYLTLCTADPGTTGANEGSGITRVNVTSSFPAASSASVANDVAITLTSLPAGTWTHIAIRDASTGGNFIRGFALSASRTTSSGDTLEFAIGELTDAIS